MTEVDAHVAAVAEEASLMAEANLAPSTASKGADAEMKLAVDEPTKEEKRTVFIANLLLNLCGVVLWAGMLTINALCASPCAARARGGRAARPPNTMRQTQLQARPNRPTEPSAPAPTPPPPTRPLRYDGIISTTGWDLSQVSLLYTLQVFTCFLACPMWGVAASYVSIRRLLAGALFAGALLNILTGIVYLTDSFAFFVILQLLKGVCLSPCQCLNRALIPKYYRLADRGKYYGLLEVAAGVGGLGGVLIGSTSYAGGTGGCYGGGGDDGCDGGFPKWAVPFLLLGGFMIPCGFLVLYFVVDPSKDTDVRAKIGEARLKIAFPGMLDEDTSLTWKLVGEMFTVKTWIFTVLQGVTGAFPWPALALLLYWFQLLGIDPFLSILVSAGPAAGAALGGGIGGLIGDRLYRRWSKKYARVAVAQTSVIVGPFLMIILFFALPQSSEYWWLFGIYGVIAGSLISWSAPNNNSNLSDVFPEATFPLAYGVSQLFEGSVSAWSPFVVSLVAENIFGVGELQNFDLKSDEKKAEDARGLGLSIFCVCCIGWGLCFLVIMPIYRYYPRESRTLQLEAALAKEAGEAGVGAVVLLHTETLDAATRV